jgi:hypothetical protein
MIVRVAARYVVCRYNQRKAQTWEYRHDRLSGSRDLHGPVDRDECCGVVGCSGRLMVDILSRALHVGGMQMPLCFPHVRRW